MIVKLDEWGPVTVLMVLATVILLGGGIVVVVVNPDTYSFPQFLDDLKTFGIGLGALGIGRGLLGGLTNLGVALHLPATDPTEKAVIPQSIDTPPDA